MEGAGEERRDRDGERKVRKGYNHPFTLILNMDVLQR